LSLLPEEKVASVSSLIDKYQKIGQESFVGSLRALDIDEVTVQKIVAFVEYKADFSSLENVATLANTPLFQEGLAELQEVVAFLEMFQTSFGQLYPYVIDFQIVRGLDYYTGTVFEGVFQKDSSFGSISGGGRYGELTGYIDAKRNDFAGVGGTIGLSRILAKVLEKQTSSQNTVAEYLFLHFPETLAETLALAAQFQSEGKKVEVYPIADKLGKQF
jgi:histidyl-tRNA synthetase